MRDLFREVDKESFIEKCGKFFQKYFSAPQITTGLIFAAVGMGVTSAGAMYADGLNFLAQGTTHLPNYFLNGIDMNQSASYIRESYSESMRNSLGMGWKQVPFYYCIGHYCGGKISEKISGIFRR